MAEKSLLKKYLESNLKKLDGGATYPLTYEKIPDGGLFTSQLTNRPSKGWPKAHILYTSTEEQNNPLDKCLEHWKKLCRDYKDQYLVISDYDSKQYLYDFNGNRLATDYDEVIAKLNKILGLETPKSPLNEPLQIIFYGAPGTGKSHKIDNDPHVTDENTIRTTFHPDSDYSTFVGAYKPTMAPMPVNAFVGTTVHHAKNADNEKAYEKKIVYKYVPQAFLKAYVDAWSDLDNPHFLIIEEINRGNCAQIFGDLFQLLDRNNMGSSSYAIHADEDITQFLAEDKNGFADLSEKQKEAIRSFVLVKDSGKTEAIGDDILSGKKLLLPPNLYIWATMNTSDQSLFPIDSAFKRRWNWEYMPIDYDAMDWQFEAGGKRYLWSDFLKKMNPLIYNLTQSSDKQMGYFFAKADKKTDDSLTENNLISEKIFLNKVLFYLWTDVLKDFEAGDKIFRDEEKGQMYQFSDFFPTTNGKLTEFVGKLELAEVGNSVSDNSAIDDEDDTSGNNTKSSKDQSRYSVNGVGTLKKGPAAVEAMKLYVQNNPEATATDIVSA